MRLYFVMRRDASGDVVSSPCHSPEDCWRRADQLRKSGYADVWIEDNDGNKVDEKTLRERK
jgi:hypothetical protein